VRGGATSSLALSFRRDVDDMLVIYIDGNCKEDTVASGYGKFGFSQEFSCECERMKRKWGAKRFFYRRNPTPLTSISNVVIISKI
jgi:hypothetical protein